MARELVQRFGGSILVPSTQAAGHVCTEGWCEEAVDDWITAGVEVSKNKEGMVDIFRDHLQHLRLEPVPDSKQVIWRPANHK